MEHDNNTVHPRNSPPGDIHFLDFCIGAYSTGNFKISLVVDQIPTEPLPLKTISSMLHVQVIVCFLKGRQIFLN